MKKSYICPICKKKHSTILKVEQTITQSLYDQELKDFVEVKRNRQTKTKIECPTCSTVLPKIFYQDIL